MNSPTAKIALDAHGTDYDTKVIIEGAKAAISDFGCQVILVGDKNEIENNLGSDGFIPGLEHFPASEIIDFHDEPATAVRKKTDSSIVVGTRLVKEGKADAMVGAGNTGAMMAAALLTLGRLPGVSRPGIAVELPAPGNGTGAQARQILIDGGATVDCEPQWLVQHAQMAKIYVEHRLNIKNPTIGLLSNGEESSKGDQLRKQAHKQLSEIEGFIGNCEGRDLTTGNPTIIVTDGFTGNVALKTIEGVYKTISSMVMEVLMKDEIADASAVVIPHLLEAAQAIHPDKYGGAVLLGVASPVVVSHGSANSDAIYNAVRVAYECVQTDVVPSIARSMES